MKSFKKYIYQRGYLVDWSENWNTTLSPGLRFLYVFIDLYTFNKHRLKSFDIDSNIFHFILGCFWEKVIWTWLLVNNFDIYIIEIFQKKSFRFFFLMYSLFFLSIHQKARGERIIISLVTDLFIYIFPLLCMYF